MSELSADEEWREDEPAFLTRMTGATLTRLSVDIDARLECIRLNMYIDGAEETKPQRLLMAPTLALQIALGLGANIERLRRALATGLEDEREGSL